MLADEDWQAVERMLSKDVATVSEFPDMEAKAQHYKNGVGSFAS